MPRALKDILLHAYFLIRLPFLYLLKLLFRAPSGEPGAISRILLIRLDRLGDFILSLPAIDTLRAVYPSAKIDMMVRPDLADLAGMVPAIDEVLIYKGKADIARTLPARKYDVVIDMLRDHRIEPAFAALLSKAPVRIGFKGGSREIFFSHAVDDWSGSSKSMVEIDMQLLRPLGIIPQMAVPKLGSVNRGKKGVLVIAIHPGGHYDSQRWAAEKFGSLAAVISEKYNVQVTVIGGPGDKKAVEAIVKEAGPTRAKAVFPSLKELVRILSGCSILICNNSGPLHLAASLGVPTVSMMGPTDPVLWWPKGDYQVVIRKGVKCSPCSRGKCKEHLCMDLITVDEVFGEARILLEKVYGIKR